MIFVEVKYRILVQLSGILETQFGKHDVLKFWLSRLRLYSVFAEFSVCVLGSLRKRAHLFSKKRFGMVRQGLLQHFVLASIFLLATVSTGQ